MTPGIRSALEKRYQRPEWALFFEVANGTGGTIRGYADAVAMNLFPSRGLAIVGHEVKVSRSDWLRELKQPQKAENLAKHCDGWWLVTLPDVVKPGELPLGWGHLELKGERLVQQTPATMERKGELPRTFMAAMLRRAHEAKERADQALIDKALVVARKNMEDEIGRRVEMRSRELAGIKEKLATLKALTGIDLTDWTPVEEVAAAVKFAVAATGLTSRYRSLGTVLGQLDKLGDHVKQIREAARANGIDLDA